MGNVCCKRQTAELESLRAEIDFKTIGDNYCHLNEAHEVVIDTNLNDGHVGESRKKNDINKLELFLNDVYERECVIKASKEEVGFIQTGIEILVQNIADLVVDFISKNEWCLSYLRLRNFRNPRNGDIEEFQNSLVEVHIPIKPDKRCVKFKTSRCIIIKVGSFYEETKNNFPDEFDFIIPLFTMGKQPHSVFSENEAQYGHVFIDCLKHVVDNNKESLNYVSLSRKLHGARKLYFDMYVTEHGPASMLKFIYKNSSGGKRNIYVDLVPACRIILDDVKRDMIKQIVKPDSFREKVLSEISCLNVRHFTSFTETEVYFIKNVLSQRHVKVYRILKCLINGHGEGETLKQILRLMPAGNSNAYCSGYSSYQLKTKMIYHHDECTNPETECVGPCVLRVLEDMCTYSQVDSFPSVFRFGSYNSANRFCLLPYVLSLTRTFKSMLIDEDKYDYEKTRMRSVSKQFLDDLVRNDPNIAEMFKYLRTLDGDEPCRDSWLKYKDAS